MDDSTGCGREPDEVVLVHDGMICGNASTQIGELGYDFQPPTPPQEPEQGPMQRRMWEIDSAAAAKIQAILLDSHMAHTALIQDGRISIEEEREECVGSERIKDEESLDRTQTADWLRTSPGSEGSHRSQCNAVGIPTQDAEHTVPQLDESCESRKRLRHKREDTCDNCEPTEQDNLPMESLLANLRCSQASKGRGTGRLDRYPFQLPSLQTVFVTFLLRSTSGIIFVARSNTACAS